MLLCYAELCEGQEYFVLQLTTGIGRRQTLMVWWMMLSMQLAGPSRTAHSMVVIPSALRHSDARVCIPHRLQNYVSTALWNSVFLHICIGP